MFSEIPAKCDRSNSSQSSSNLIRLPGQPTLNFPKATSDSRAFQIRTATGLEDDLVDSQICSRLCRQVDAQLDTKYSKICANTLRPSSNARLPHAGQRSERGQPSSETMESIFAAISSGFSIRRLWQSRIRFPASKQPTIIRPQSKVRLQIPPKVESQRG